MSESKMQNRATGSILVPDAPRGTPAPSAPERRVTGRAARAAIGSRLVRRAALSSSGSILLLSLAGRAFAQDPAPEPEPAAPPAEGAPAEAAPADAAPADPSAAL